MAQGKSRFRFDILLLLVAVIGVGVGGAGLYYNQTLSGRHATWITVVKQLQTDALEVSRVAEDVGRGLTPNFPVLVGQSENFADTVRIMRDGDVDFEIEPLPAEVSDELAAVEQSWATMQESLNQLIASEPAVSAATGNLGTLDAAGVELFEIYRTAAERLAASGAFADRQLRAGEQMARAERLRTLSRRLLGEGRDAGTVAAEIGAEIEALSQTHASLVGDGPVGSFLQANSETVERVVTAGGAIVAAGPELDQMQAAAGVVPGNSRDLYSTAIGLEDALLPLQGEGQIQQTAILPALGVAVVSLLLYVLINIVSVRRRIRAAEERDRRQQAAILSLLDEISDLADGDLTVRANVTADFTGAIADSVNSTVETLRSLVGTINETAVEISAAATATQETAATMEAASESQVQEVAEIAQRMQQSSDSLTAVAQRAEQLAAQATTSVNVAHSGASTVGRTIQGMAALREQIQDTAKRIKRLGESSQEIGNIIEFINDIAEQTNTLALNASIQAAMAGESGRGFAVVADEVQRLAERAAAATRQIETLVKTIQADTNEAIVSMERSTTNVVAGARSAEEAGQALTRIESNSTDLSRFIQAISGEARNEAAQATHIAGQIQSIRETAIQTAASAQITSDAVGELNALSTKLRESVAGFKLPADVSLEGEDENQPDPAFALPPS